MNTETIELSGRGLVFVDDALRARLRGYHGVKDVRTKWQGDKLILAVDYDEEAAGEFDDSALFILERYHGLTNVRARFLEPPPWAVSLNCKNERHATCGGTVDSEYWQTSLVCDCLCHKETQE